MKNEAERLVMDWLAGRADPATENELTHFCHPFGSQAVPGGPTALRLILANDLPLSRNRQRIGLLRPIQLNTNERDYTIGIIRKQEK
jgi:hypothetical protein